MKYSRTPVVTRTLIIIPPVVSLRVISQATCAHVRLLEIVGGDERLTEDSANELISVLQVAL